MMLFVIGFFLIMIILGGLRCQLALGERPRARAGSYAVWMTLLGFAGSIGAFVGAAVLGDALGWSELIDTGAYVALVLGGLGGMELGFVIASRRQSRLR